MVQTSKQIGRRNIFVATMFLHAKKNVCYYLRIALCFGMAKYTPITEQAQKKIPAFILQFQHV